MPRKTKKTPLSKLKKEIIAGKNLRTYKPDKVIEATVELYLEGKISLGQVPVELFDNTMIEAAKQEPRITDEPDKLDDGDFEFLTALRRTTDDLLIRLGRVTIELMRLEDREEQLQDQQIQLKDGSGVLLRRFDLIKDVLVRRYRVENGSLNIDDGTITRAGQEEEE